MERGQAMTNTACWRRGSSLDIHSNGRSWSVSLDEAQELIHHITICLEGAEQSISPGYFDLEAYFKTKRQVHKGDLVTMLGLGAKPTEPIRRRF